VPIIKINRRRRDIDDFWRDFARLQKPVVER
jgi:hypothetical protein